MSTDPVSSRRYGVADLFRDRAARGLEANPFTSLVQAGNRHQFAPVEPNQRGIDHVVRGHDDRRGQVLPGEVDDRPLRATRDECGRGRIGPARQRGDVERDHVIHLLDVGVENGAMDALPALLTSMVMV